MQARETCFAFYTHRVISCDVPSVPSSSGDFSPAWHTGVNTTGSLCAFVLGRNEYCIETGSQLKKNSKLYLSKVLGPQ